MTVFISLASPVTLCLLCLQNPLLRRVSLVSHAARGICAPLPEGLVEGPPRMKEPPGYLETPFYFTRGSSCFKIGEPGTQA